MRKAKGHAMLEFGVGMLVFICFIFIPLIDIGFIPVRYVIGSGTINEFTHRLSLNEKRSEAYQQLTDEGGWKTFLSQCGVTVHEPQLNLVICGKDESEQVSIGKGVAVPAEWLPNGKNGPCIYSLELATDCDIAPLFPCSSGGMPGFTKPITLTLKSKSQWENLGRNPQTLAYYINE